MTDNPLLEPTLTADASVTAPLYSLQVGFLSSFLGGRLAAVIITAIHSHRLRRLARDLPLLLAGAALTLAMAWWTQRMRGGAWLAAHSIGSAIPVRAAGPGYFGLCYLAHRTAYRDMQMMGIPSPSGWIPGIAATIAGRAAAYRYPHGDRSGMITACSNQGRSTRA